MNKSASGISLNVFHNERVVIREITLQIEKCVVDDGHMSTCQENTTYQHVKKTLCTVLQATDFVQINWQKQNLPPPHFLASFPPDVTS